MLLRDTWRGKEGTYGQTIQRKLRASGITTPVPVSNFAANFEKIKMLCESCFTSALNHITTLFFKLLFRDTLRAACPSESAPKNHCGKHKDIERSQPTKTYSQQNTSQNSNKYSNK
jgi:hypothetical protein